MPLERFPNTYLSGYSLNTFHRLNACGGRAGQGGSNRGVHEARHDETFSQDEQVIGVCDRRRR
jgi:hypothetical protein